MIIRLGVSGAANAKLVAQKSKGMPVISISLTELVGSAASAAIANLSLELFKAFKSIHDLYREGGILFLFIFLTIHLYVHKYTCTLLLGKKW